MGGMTWEERLTPEQKQQVENELKAFGLDTRQIKSLMRLRGRVSPLELELMKKLPDNRYGQRPTIGAVRGAITTLKNLGLITEKKQQ